MRKNTARHWLHAALDLLPVILIPVFMIYSHRHSMTEQTTVDIHYKYQSNEVNSLDDLIADNIYYCEYLPLSYIGTNFVNSNIQFKILSYEYVDYEISGEVNDFVLDPYNNKEDNYIAVIYNGYNTGDGGLLSLTNGNAYVQIVFDSNNDEYLTFEKCIIQVPNNSLNKFKLFYQDLMSDFGSEVPLPQYTDYNILESVDVNDETSSVMNVFMDNFNNAVDKYFNMGNVFNMNNVYQWFNTNIFGGNAPTIIYSVWNITLYELVMDLLFLLYGLFMWFIDMCKALIEKPINSIK